MPDDDKKDDKQPDNGGNDDPKGDDKEPDWKAEAEKWKNLARKHEDTAKKNSDAATRLKELEDSQKSELQKLTESKEATDKELSAARLELARTRVALRKGLTEAQAKRLIGETEEDLEKDADELLATFSQKEDDADKGSSSRTPRERMPRSGSSSSKEPEETDPIKLAAAVPR